MKGMEWNAKQWKRKGKDGNEEWRGEERKKRETEVMVVNWNAV